MEARHRMMLTGCHQVARTPPAFFSLELRRPLKSRSTATVLRLRSASAIATELPTIPAPTTHTSKRPPRFTRNTLASVGRYALTRAPFLGAAIQIVKEFVFPNGERRRTREPAHDAAAGAGRPSWFSGRSTRVAFSDLRPGLVSPT